MKIQENNFWSKVNRGGKCWEWEAATDSFGYGRFNVGGVNEGAHRVSWILAKGKIPSDACVLHMCDNPKCVNPEHLFLGTREENNKDRMLKGRNGMIKIKIKDVPRIRELIDDNVSIPRIADMFGVHRGSIHAIKKNKTFKYA